METPAEPRSLAEIADALAAAQDRTPSTVVNAFVPDRMTAAGINLPPITTKTWMLLEKIQSPFAQAKFDVDPTIEQTMQAFYIIVSPWQQVDSEIYAGADVFKSSVDAFASGIAMREFPTIAEAIAKHIAAEFAPRAEMERPGEDGGDDSPLAASLPEATAPEAS